MLVPQLRGDLEQFAVRQAELSSNPELYDGYTTWIKSRQEFLAAHAKATWKLIKKKYQKHYFQGCTNGGVFFEGHQKKRELAAFEGPSATNPPSPTRKPVESAAQAGINHSERYFR